MSSDKAVLKNNKNELYMGHPKSSPIDKNFVLPTIRTKRKPGFRVFDHADSKSESWHRAKKVRGVFAKQIDLRTFFHS